VVAYEAEDTVGSRRLIRDPAGNSYRPEDYLDLFSRYVRDNRERVEALQILLARPRDWSPAALRELRNALAAAPEHFSEDGLRLAHQLRHDQALADIISMVKRAAGDAQPLLTAEERVKLAVLKITAATSLNPEQQRWLDRIRDHLVANLSIDRQDFETVQVLERQGGWAAADRAFQGHLAETLTALNEAIAA
jgi:type I restriction enzyme R subunit